MAEHAGHQPHHGDVGHEESDVNFGAIMTFAGGLVALAAVVYFVVWLLFGYLTRQENAASANLIYPLAAGQEDRLPPEPRLQIHPRQDLQDLRESEDALLKSYSWVDRNGGVVRIPIDEAMKLTLQRGLPSRPASEREVMK
jgi:cbb3-type cytochrome oxidase subunit 3